MLQANRLRNAVSRLCVQQYCCICMSCNERMFHLELQYPGRQSYSNQSSIATIEAFKISRDPQKNLKAKFTLSDIK